MSATAWTLVGWIGQPDADPVRIESGRLYTTEAHALNSPCGDTFSELWTLDTKSQPGAWLDDVTAEPVTDLAAFVARVTAGLPDPCPCCQAPAGTPCT